MYETTDVDTVKRYFRMKEAAEEKGCRLVIVGRLFQLIADEWIVCEASGLHGIESTLRDLKKVPQVIRDDRVGG